MQDDDEEPAQEFSNQGLMIMKYCQSCILPDTRPGILIGENGVCNACTRHRTRVGGVDWNARADRFRGLVREAKERKRPFDCVVPVSGGKDSTYQVVRCLEHGLKVLAVTWRSPGRSALGQENLDNLIHLGVDHIDYSINPEVERKFTYTSFVKTGSSAVPMHYGLFVVPLRLAVLYRIPLVVWGESPNMEYGGVSDEHLDQNLDHKFLKQHGILQGTTIDDWVDANLSVEDLWSYRVPSEEEFVESKLKSVFIGYFFPWSPQESLATAQAHGFKVRAEGPKVGLYNFADVDCDFVSVHHYFKWLKFGFTRLFDNLSLEIRNGLMTREEAIETVRAMGPQVPHDDIRAFCGYLKISEEHFWEIAERFRSPHVWKKRGNQWVIPNFIAEPWDWWGK